MSIKSDSYRKLMVATDKYRDGYDAIDWSSNPNERKVVAGEDLEPGDLVYEKDGKVFKWEGLEQQNLFSQERQKWVDDYFYAEKQRKLISPLKWNEFNDKPTWILVPIFIFIVLAVLLGTL